MKGLITQRFRLFHLTSNYISLLLSHSLASHLNMLSSLALLALVPAVALAVSPPFLKSHMTGVSRVSSPPARLPLPSPPLLPPLHIIRRHSTSMSAKMDLSSLPTLSLEPFRETPCASLPPPPLDLPHLTPR